MNNGGFGATWLDEAPMLFIIFALVFLNIILLYVAWVQNRQRRKVERDLLAVQTFGSASPFAAKRPLDTEKKRLPKETLKTIADDLSLLKIDKAIAMLKIGSPLEEIRAALDIETSYLKILASHHTK